MSAASRVLILGWPDPSRLTLQVQTVNNILTRVQEADFLQKKHVADLQLSKIQRTQRRLGEKPVLYTEYSQPWDWVTHTTRWAWKGKGGAGFRPVKRRQDNDGRETNDVLVLRLLFVGSVTEYLLVNYSVLCTRFRTLHFKLHVLNTKRRGGNTKLFLAFPKVSSIGKTTWRALFSSVGYELLTYSLTLPPTLPWSRGEGRNQDGDI